MSISGIRKEGYIVNVYRFSHLLPHPRYDIFCFRFLEDIFKRFDINIFLYVNYVWKKRFHRVIPSKWDVFENNREVMRWATGIIERSDFSTLAHHFIKLNAGPKIIDFVRYRYRARGSWFLSVGWFTGFEIDLPNGWNTRGKTIST